MKATYEDVYQTQHPNVEEYLKHVQQATLLSAIHVRSWFALDLSVLLMSICAEKITRA